MLKLRAARELASIVKVFSLLRLKAEMPFYAVAKGRAPGIYATWSECQTQVQGFLGARYKKFSTMTEAEEFIEENSSTNIVDNRQSSQVTSNINSKLSGVSVKEAKRNPMKRTIPSEYSENDDDGRLSPTVLEMKKEMKRLQKDLSDLRSRFDEYVAGKSKGGVTSQSRGLHTSAAVPAKRRRGSSEDDVIELDGPSTSSKKNKKVESLGNNSKFMTDNEGFLIVYTDGACESNGKLGAKAGVGVFFGKDHPLNVSEPVKGRPTNNTAEIQAATYALELAQASGFDKVAVHTDSQFMINCMTAWLKNWKRKNWVKADGQPVKNKEDLVDLDKATEGLMVKWVHVKGHAGIIGNEEADRLAREGARHYKDT